MLKIIKKSFKEKIRFQGIKDTTLNKSLNLPKCLFYKEEQGLKILKAKIN